MTNSEKALQMHEQWNGKLENCSPKHMSIPEKIWQFAYTPGVAEPCKGDRKRSRS